MSEGKKKHYTHILCGDRSNTIPKWAATATHNLWFWKKGIIKYNPTVFAFRSFFFFLTWNFGVFSVVCVSFRIRISDWFLFMRARTLDFSLYIILFSFVFFSSFLKFWNNIFSDFSSLCCSFLSFMRVKNSMCNREITALWRAKRHRIWCVPAIWIEVVRLLSFSLFALLGFHFVIFFRSFFHWFGRHCHNCNCICVMCCFCTLCRIITVM